MNYFQILILISAAIFADAQRNGPGVGTNGVGVGQRGIGVGGQVGVGANGVGIRGPGVGTGFNPLLARAALSSAGITAITDSALSERVAHRTSIMSEHLQSASDFKATNTAISDYVDYRTSIMSERVQSISDFKATNTVVEAVSASFAAYTATASAPAS